MRRAVGPLVTRALEMSRTDRGGAECGNVRRVSRHVYRALYDVGEELREQCGRRDASDEHVRLVGGRCGQQFEQRSHREAHALEDRATHCHMDKSCTDWRGGAFVGSIGTLLTSLATCRRPDTDEACACVLVADGATRAAEVREIQEPAAAWRRALGGSVNPGQ